MLKNNVRRCQIYLTSKKTKSNEYVMSQMNMKSSVLSGQRLNKQVGYSFLYLRYFSDATW